MAIDIKKEAEKLIGLIQKNPLMVAEFTKDPVKFVEKKTGLDLPDDQINKIIAIVKKEAAKLAKNVDKEKVAKGVSLVKGLLKK